MKRKIQGKYRKDKLKNKIPSKIEVLLVAAIVSLLTILIVYFDY